MGNKGNAAKARYVAGRRRSLPLDGEGRTLARHAARQRQNLHKAARSWLRMGGRLDQRLAQRLSSQTHDVVERIAVTIHVKH